jgi:hypothetical protein
MMMMMIQMIANSMQMRIKSLKKEELSFGRVYISTQQKRFTYIHLSAQLYGQLLTSITKKREE